MMKARLEYKGGTLYKYIEIKEWRDILKIAVKAPINPTTYFTEGKPVNYTDMIYSEMIFQWIHDDVWICIESR